MVHKFGRKSEHGDYDNFIEELNASLASDFKAKGNIFVFVDECHRTQSGKLHSAMKMILPDALFIGFTGTPLLKKDKQKSLLGYRKAKKMDIDKGLRETFAGQQMTVKS